MFLNAVRRGSRCLAAINMLLLMGAHLHAVDRDGHTALHLAASAPVDDPAVVSMLLSKGLDVDGPSEFFETPAHRASRFGCVNCLCALMEAGADVRARNAASLSVLDVAGVVGITANDSIRKRSRETILARHAALRTLVMTHDDCVAHVPWKSHQESPERIVAIMASLESNRFSGTDLVISNDARVADEEMVTRAHSKV